MGNNPSALIWFITIKNPDNLGLPTYRVEIVAKTEQLKRCCTCNYLMSLSQYRKCKSGKYGVDSSCKICRKSMYKKRTSDLEYKSKLAKQRADNHIQNKDKYNARHKVDFQKNKTKIYARRKQYYLNNPDKMSAELHRQHVRNALKSGKEAPELLGCDSKFLHKWFEFHFSINTEMNMANHGSYWHIDHVIPINKWDLTNEEHKKLCFNWKNLMPLEATSNISKHDNINIDQVKEQNKRLKLFSKITGEEYPDTPVDVVF